MRAYADSSFILKLLGGEPNSDEVAAAYSREGKPKLFFLSLHELEVMNAILQRAFHQRRSISSKERKMVAVERDRAVARFNNAALRRRFLEVSPDVELVHQTAMELVLRHTERSGARAIDILHVAHALALETELFLTADSRQAQVAESEGLKVVVVG